MGSSRLGNWFWAILICAVGAIFTFAVHHPAVGIDDANITQTYARNIAGGEGYVYSLHGERVEGSTSLLWTLVNALFFTLTDAPERWIALLTFLITAASVHEMVGLLRVVARRQAISEPVTLAVFALTLWCAPAFFTWSVWTLMDLTIWVWCFSVIFARLAQAAMTAQPLPAAFWQPVWIALIALPLVRPEGVALLLVFGALLLLLSWRQGSNSLMRSTVIVCGSSFVLLLAVTAWRLVYFGFPFPNTFYAKVSMSVLLQAKQGLIYTYVFLKSPANLFLSCLCLLGIFLLARKANRAHGTQAWSDRLLLPCVLVLPFAAVIGIYVLVGGDHFGSARQFQVFMPALCALSASCLAAVCLTVSGAVLRIAVLAPLLVCLLASTLGYTKNKGLLDLEFRIAESGRELGDMLNQFPQLKSVGIVAAGGVSRTYRGHLDDLVGLNWVEMAHAPKGVANVMRPKNHAAFNKEVLYRRAPDIILPTTDECNRSRFVGNDFNQSVMDNIFEEPRFRSLYAFACYRAVSFFVRKDLIAHWPQGLRLADD